MSQSNVEITDKDHWRKEIPLQKAIIYIGCDQGNDIVLDPAHGAGVAPRHIQLLSLRTGAPGYRLVNLGDAEIRSVTSGARAIPPRSFADVADGDSLQLGDFVLTFRFSADVGALESAPAAPVMAGAVPAAPVMAGAVPAAPAMVGAAPTAPVMASAAPTAPVVAAAAPAPAPESGPPSQGSIGLSVALPDTQLAPDRLLEGRVTVCNRGSKPGVQFKLQVEGLDPDCYEIGAGPILFPGAEKDVSFCLTHPRRSRPVAGEHRFIIRATAAEAYPGESAVVSQVIRIMPFYSHKLRVVSG